MLVLEVVGVAIVVVSTTLFGFWWFSRYYQAAVAALLVSVVLSVKFVVTVFRYVVAIAGSENVNHTSDTFRYLQYGEELVRTGGNLADRFFAGDETDRVIVVSAAAHTVFGGSWISVYFFGAFLGAIAMFVLWGVACEVFQGVRPAYALLFCLFPSVLYWTSSFGKESLTLFGLSIGVYGFMLIWRSAGGLSWVGAVLVISSFLVLFSFRVEVALLLSFAAIGSILSVGRKAVGSGRSELSPTRVGLVAVLLLMLAVVIPAVFGVGSTGLSDNLTGRYENTSIGDSQIGSDRPDGLGGLIFGIPTAVFRPFPWESGVAGLVSSLDTLVILAAGYCCMGLLRLRTDSLFGPTATRVLGVSVFVSLGLFAALAGYGNLGLLVRMRSMVIPFCLLIVLGYLLRRRQVLQRGSSGSRVR